jgi:hypothetical protein
MCDLTGHYQKQGLVYGTKPVEGQHPLLNAEKSMVFHLMCKKIKKLKGNARICDVGGARHQWTRTHWGDVLHPHVMAPLVSPADFSRNSEKDVDCRCLAQECQHIVGNNIATFSHTLYYFKPEDVYNIIKQTTLGVGFAIIHKFPEVAATLPNDEASYRRVRSDSGKLDHVIFSAKGNQPYPSHSALDWMSSGEFISSDNRQMVWSAVHQEGSTWLYEFRINQIGRKLVPHRELAFREVESQIEVAAGKHPFLQRHTTALGTVSENMHNFIVHSNSVGEEGYATEVPKILVEAGRVYMLEHDHTASSFRSLTGVLIRQSKDMLRKKEISETNSDIIRTAAVIAFASGIEASIRVNSGLATHRHVYEAANRAKMFEPQVWSTRAKALLSALLWVPSGLTIAKWTGHLSMTLACVLGGALVVGGLAYGAYIIYSNWEDPFQSEEVKKEKEKSLKFDRLHHPPQDPNGKWGVAVPREGFSEEFLPEEEAKLEPPVSTRIDEQSVERPKWGRTKIPQIPFAGVAYYAEQIDAYGVNNLEKMRDVNVFTAASGPQAWAVQAVETSLTPINLKTPLYCVRNSTAPVRTADEVYVRKKFHLLGPAYLPLLPLVHADTVHNEAVALTVRHLKKAPSGPANVAAWKRASEAVHPILLKQTMPFYRPRGFLEWEARLEPTIRAAQAKARAAVPYDIADASRSDDRAFFVKKELVVPKAEPGYDARVKAPRGIQGLANLTGREILGPFMYGISKALAYAYNDVNLEKCTSSDWPRYSYTSGGTADRAGQWFDDHFVRDDYECVKNDYSQYDSTQGEGAHRCEIAFYNHFPMTAASAEALEAQGFTKGYGRYHAYRCPFTRKSGDQNTSTGNSVLNFTGIGGAIAAFCEEFGVTCTFHMLGLGDDGLLAIKWFRNGFRVHGLSAHAAPWMAKWIESELGFVCKMKAVPPTAADYCSGEFLPVLSRGRQTHLLVPTVSRVLCKSFFTAKQVQGVKRGDDTGILQRLKGLALSTHAWSLVPILRVFFYYYGDLDVTAHDGLVRKKLSLGLKARLTNTGLRAYDRTLDWWEETYGGASEIQDVEQRLMTHLEETHGGPSFWADSAVTEMLIKRIRTSADFLPKKHVVLEDEGMAYLHFVPCQLDPVCEGDACACGNCVSGLP